MGVLWKVKLVEIQIGCSWDYFYRLHSQQEKEAALLKQRRGEVGIICGVTAWAEGPGAGQQPGLS